MSVNAYFRDLTNLPDYQRRASYPGMVKTTPPVECRSFCFDASPSEDSNNSTFSTGSSTSFGSDLTTLSDISALSDFETPSKESLANFGAINKLFHFGSPKKSLQYCLQPRRKSTPRKSLRPTKTPNKTDPLFHGVTLQMKTTVKRRNNDIETQLVIRSSYSEKKKRLAAVRSGTTALALTMTSSPRLLPSSLEHRFEAMPSKLGNLKENYNDLGCLPMALSGRKVCVSCGVDKTPLWRNAEDGTSLCNACGIRYKKYHIRCSKCWYIPKKAEHASSGCKNCGGVIKVSRSFANHFFTYI